MTPKYRKIEETESIGIMLVIEIMNKQCNGSFPSRLQQPFNAEIITNEVSNCREKADVLKCCGSRVQIALSHSHARIEMVTARMIHSIHSGD